MKEKISVSIHIEKPIEVIWEYWTKSEHITKWCFASSDWCAPRAENDVRVGGTFLTRMEAKDGSVGFDMTGTYTEVEENKKLIYKMDDEREVITEFIPEQNGFTIIESFDPEDINSRELQQQGWQAILNNFKKYVEEQ